MKDMGYGSDFLFFLTDSPKAVAISLSKNVASLGLHPPPSFSMSIIQAPGSLVCLGLIETLQQLLSFSFSGSEIRPACPEK